MGDFDLEEYADQVGALFFWHVDYEATEKFVNLIEIFKFLGIVRFGLAE